MVVGVTGGLAVLLAVAGWLVVEARAGPFEHAVEPAEVELAIEGSYASSREGLAGTGCPAGTPEPACGENRIRVELAVTGLPVLDGAGRYGAFLTGEDRTVSLGPLTRDAGVHSLSVDEAASDEGLDRLVVTLVPDADAGPSRFIVYAAPLPEDASDPVALPGMARARLPAEAGSVSLGQVGVFAVSATTEVRIPGLVFDPAWRYDAWLVDDEGPDTRLGTLAPSGSGAGVMDERVPQVELADQERFAVHLVPASVDPSPTRHGFPVASVPLETTSLFG